MLRQLWIDLRVRLLGLFGRRRLYTRADEEIQTHIALREERLIQSGVPAGEARLRARREFGNPVSVREASVEAWPFRLLHQLRQDVGYGIRTLGRAPAFTAAVILTARPVADRRGLRDRGGPRRRARPRPVDHGVRPGPRDPGPDRRAGPVSVHRRRCCGRAGSPFRTAYFAPIPCSGPAGPATRTRGPAGCI